jgi:hypothetical protein
MKPKVLAVFALALSCLSASAQLFENLRALGGTRYPVGDPALVVTNLDGDRIQGPKDIAVSDLDGDGNPDFAVANKDGTVTLRFGVGDGTFGGPMHLYTVANGPTDLRNYYFTNYFTNVVCNFVETNRYFTNNPPPLPDGTTFPPRIYTNTQWVCDGTYRTNVMTNVWDMEGPFGLRGLAIADFTGDGRPDIAVASPGESVIYLFVNTGGRTFAPAAQLPGWFGVRDLAAGDFDGDGHIDLAAGGTTNGVVQYRNLGNGNFQVVANLVALGSGPIEEDDFDFPQPAFYLEAVRQPGDTRDELVVSYAQKGRIWILRGGTDGKLAVAGDIENVNVTALDTGPLFRPATNTLPDLVVSYSRGGWIDIFPATNLMQRFSGRAAVRYYVPGGPRNVRIVDLDQDGWNDLVVVSQLSDRVLIYHNDHGQFSLVTEASAGRFPREMDVGDFNHDGRPDLAVLNRYSMDASILITTTNTGNSVGFLALDNVYPVDGGVSGLELRDLNGDGRLDVLQLHRDSGEFSVRITDSVGRLGLPTYYPITNAFQPAAQITADVNGDGRADMVSANLSGSVTVRLGLAGGGFGDPQTFSLPADARGSLFALVPGDFDGDGHMDLAAGYLDCRVSFFRGNGDGTFTFTHTHPFIYEPRSMVVGDFDQDGDLDLAGASWTGNLVVVENRGDLLTTTTLTKSVYGGGGAAGSMMRMVDQNNDGDPDFLFGAEGQFDLFLGGPGLTFTHQTVSNTSNDPRIAGSTFVIADLNGDGISDVAAVCASNSCLTISFYINNVFVPVLTVPVPNTRYLAAGDLDGDGFTDLVGSGDVLWVALSSRRATNAPPTQPLAARNSTRRVVINEVLPRNDSLPLAQDGNRNTDWVEIYNGSGVPVVLSGWRLLLARTSTIVTGTTNFVNGTNQVTFTTNSVVVTNTFAFPNDIMAAGAFRLVICSDRIRTPYHTGFNLPSEASTLYLLDAQGAEVDRVDYPALDANLSYARYQDGLRSFVVNNIPSAGAPNLDNGAVDPIIDVKGVDLEDIRAVGQPIHIRATGRDDQGIVNVSMLWRRLDIVDPDTKRLVLYDDGMNGGDAVLNDGNFTGMLVEDLPAGAAIQFYLECTDISDEIVTKPGNPRFVSPGETPDVYTFAVGVLPPPLEISEIVADNAGGLQDELGGTPDWVEIRNCSGTAVSLNGIGLSPKFFGSSERIALDGLPALAGGQHMVIYCDSKPSQGPLHAPFKLDAASGEQLVLTGTSSTGARYLIDSVAYGPQAQNVALSRLGCGGPWVSNIPTPRAGNVAGVWKAVVDGDSFLLAYPTLSGRRYIVEYNNTLRTNGWTPILPSQQGLGAEQTIRQPLQSRRFYRVREQ